MTMIYLLEEADDQLFRCFLTMSTYCTITSWSVLGPTYVTSWDRVDVIKNSLPRQAFAVEMTSLLGCCIIT